jgi:hypothetical protein
MKSQKLFYFLSLAGLVFAGCSSAPELESKWRQSEIIVDGLDTEWHQDLSYLEKEKIAVGIKNDAENLYFSIKTIDRETQMKIVRGGMTVWFDSTGASKQIFGIHFPLGASDAGAQPTHIRGSRETSDETNDFMALEERYSRMLQNMEIIGPGRVDKKQIPVISSYKTYGIKVGLRDTIGTLFYELVVPLKMTTAKPLAICSDTGKTIGIGIITENTKRPMVAHAPDEGAPNGGYGKPGMGGGGYGGGGGRREGGGAGRGGANPAASISPIELWMKVKIAGNCILL